MAANERERTISYCRAQFSDEQALTMAQYVNAAHAKAKGVEDRTFLVDGQEIKGCHVRSRIKKGTNIKREYVHIAVSTPGEKMSLVPKAGKAEAVDLDTLPAPEGKDFMDGDIMLFIQGNHVLFCSTGLRISKAKEYLMLIFSETDQPDEALAFSLMNVADVNKVNLIRERGVKRLHMDAGLFTAAQEHDKRVHRTALQRLALAFSDELKALFAKEPKLKEYSETENLTAELVLKFDRRFQGGEVGQMRIESLAEKLLEGGDEDGFKIVTFDDEVISANSISLKKKVKVPKDGKTVAYQSVWTEMRTYLGELQGKGLLDQ